MWSRCRHYSSKKLRAVASGAACYLHVVENTAKNLKNVGITKGVVKGEKTLNQLAEMFGIESDEKYDKCIKVADKVINDLYKSRDDKMELVEKIA